MSDVPEDPPGQGGQLPPPNNPPQLPPRTPPVPPHPRKKEGTDDE